MINLRLCFFLLFCFSTGLIAAPPDPNISDVVLNELLFNPGDISPTTNLGQDCDGDGTSGEDGSSGSTNADDEFIEFYNNGATDVDLSGYCISNRDIVTLPLTLDSTSSWLIPSGATVPAGGFYYICGEDDGRGFGFSIADSNGNQVAQFSNNSGINTWASLYEPVTPGDCTSGVQTVIFSEDYGDGEANGEPYLRCFTDGVSALDFYDDGSGNFYVPTPGSANCTIATPVYLNHIKYDENIISWQTGFEFKHIGFNLYNERKEKINSQLIPSDITQDYQFNLKSKSYPQYVVLTSVDADGTEKTLKEISRNSEFGSREIAEKINWTDNSSAIKTSRVSSEIKLLVNTDGIQKIKVNDVISNGMNISGMYLHNLKLTFAGKAIPFYLDSKSKIIQPEDTIYFIGHKANSIYSDKSIYTLGITTFNTAAIEPISGVINNNTGFPNFYQKTLIIEENNRYEFSSSSEDPWMMKRLLVYKEPAISSHTIDLPGLYIPPSTSYDRKSQLSVTANILGVTDFSGSSDDHHIGLQLNNNPAVYQFFDGQQEINLTQKITPDSDQINIKLIQPADTDYAYDLVNLNKFIINYPSKFYANNGQIDFKTVYPGQYKVSGFNNDELIILAQTGNKTFKINNYTLRNTSIGLDLMFHNPIQDAQLYISELNSINQPELFTSNELDNTKADFLILTTETFISELDDYISEKQNQGYKVKVTSVEDIYSNLSNTYNNPDSIKEYIIRQNNNQPLKYILLVGSDQYDYKNYLGINAVSHIPTYYKNTGHGIYHAPTDTPYADLNNDDIVDIPLGRLLANNSDELRNLLQKISAYKETPYSSELFVTDNTDSYRFISIAESLSETSNLNTTILRSNELGIEQTRQLMTDSLNQGVKVLNWIGHSSPTRWSLDNLMEVRDVPELHNPPALFFQLGCWNSYFVDPIKQNLSAALIQSPQYGAVATIGSSTYTGSDGEAEFAQYFKSYIQNHNTATIGEAFLYAMQKYGEHNPDRKDILQGYQLLGDPSMKFE